MATSRTLAAPSQHRELVKKSVFLAHAGPAASVDEAMRFIDAHSDPAATHNCWAYRIGNAYRFNDDGEPGGTAGRPILQAIEGQDCDKVALVVTRWFGGIKLGAGGLVRAYGGCAANCLRQAVLVDIIDSVEIVCGCRFADLPWLKARAAQAGAGIVDESFDETGVTLVLNVPRAQANELGAAVADATRGQASWQVRGNA